MIPRLNQCLALPSAVYLGTNTHDGLGQAIVTPLVQGVGQTGMVHPCPAKAAYFSTTHLATGSGVCHGHIPQQPVRTHHTTLQPKPWTHSSQRTTQYAHVKTLTESLRDYFSRNVLQTCPNIALIKSLRLFLQKFSPNFSKYVSHQIPWIISPNIFSKYSSRFSFHRNSVRLSFPGILSNICPYMAICLKIPWKYFASQVNHLSGTVHAITASPDVLPVGHSEQKTPVELVITPVCRGGSHDHPIQNSSICHNTLT